MRLYTAEEAAEVLRLSKWTVWKYGREGRLKTVRFGRTVRYDLEGGLYGSAESGDHRADAYGSVCRNADSGSSKLGG